MTQIETVTGPVDAARLGVTLVHEHVLVRSDAVQAQFPRVYENDGLFQAAVDAFANLRRRGVESVCDPTVMGLGRDVAFARRVADATGMNIVVATGLYTLSRLPPLFAHRAAEFLADLFVADIEEGIQGTDIKAAFLKCATDERGVTPDVEKTLQAAAKAHMRTGVPIMTHSLPANESGLRQQDIFENEGVDLHRVLIGHCGDTSDVDYLRRILDRGSYIGMDRYGLDELLDTEQRNQTVQALCSLGYADRILLSQDAVCLSDHVYPEAVKARRPNWNLFYVVDHVAGQLVDLGVDQSVVDSMLSDNVRGWLVG